MADSVTGSVALPNSAAVAATAAPRLVSAPVPMDTTHVQLPTTPAAAAAVVGTTAAPSLVPGSIALPMAPVPMGAPHLPTAPAPPAAVMAGNTEEDDDDSEDDDDEEDEDSGSTTPEPQRKRRKIDPVSRRSHTGLNLLQKFCSKFVFNFQLTPIMVSGSLLQLRTRFLAFLTPSPPL